jgi:hypothetical protein
MLSVPEQYWREASNKFTKEISRNISERSVVFLLLNEDND